MNTSLNRSPNEIVPLRLQILDLLKHNGVMSLHEISDALGCDDDRVYQSLKRLWKKDIVLRTQAPMFLRNKVHTSQKKVTVQKIFRVCRDEKQVRGMLDRMWKGPNKAKEILNRVMSRNEDIFIFERMLEK